MSSIYNNSILSSINYEISPATSSSSLSQDASISSPQLCSSSIEFQNYDSSSLWENQIQPFTDDESDMAFDLGQSALSVAAKTGSVQENMNVVVSADYVFDSPPANVVQASN